MIIAPKSPGLIAGALALAMATTACLGLDVTNPNEPDRDRALSTPGDVEALINSQFRVWWTMQQGNTAMALDALAELESGTQANYGFQDQGEMPPIPIVNQVAYIWGYWMQDPFLLQNRALAALRDGLQSIESRNLQMDQPARIQAFAKLMQGLFHGNIALLYDRGFVLDETVQDAGAIELQSYEEVMAAARRYLAEARSIAAQSNFTVPDGWLGPGAKTSQTLIRLTHAYEARFMAQVARSPQERGQVNWSEVLSHVEQGIVEDFGVELDGPGGIWNSTLKQRSSLNANTALAFIGPADQSGAYAAWEDTPFAQRDVFLIDTDDRRVTDGTPTGPGRYVVYRPFLTGAPERGRFFLSNYARQWWKDIGDTGFGFAPDITVREMEFLAAEAHLRLGNPEAALALINKERVEVGELPPASLEGAVGDRCVPRSVGLLAKASSRPNGACGDLLQTLIYEKRMAVAFLSQGSVYYDARGFGTLRTGRAIHAPIPAEDLQVLAIPVYSFGGVGGEGAAP
jgi:starch-binding outer membrane protein, SusD/RagB family